MELILVSGEASTFLILVFDPSFSKSPLKSLQMMETFKTKIPTKFVDICQKRV